MGGKRAGVVTLSAGAVLPVCGCSLSLEWRRVAEALIWLVQMTRGSPFARCWSTAPEVASYRRLLGTTEAEASPARGRQTAWSEAAILADGPIW